VKRNVKVTKSLDDIRFPVEVRGWWVRVFDVFGVQVGGWVGGLGVAFWGMGGDVFLGRFLQLWLFGLADW